jgi:dTDP-4-dehydrorhamnose 3,5-epimerase
VSQLTVTTLDIDGPLLITPAIRRDHRGSFSETYNERAFAAVGVTTRFVQDNQSSSPRRGTVRGLHFQTPPEPQAKLVRVIAGAIFDVVVDIRVGSPAYGRWTAATLTGAAGEQMWIPRGFAHGFCTLEPDTVIAYKVDGPYAPECEAGLHWRDPDLAIAWPVPEAEAVIADRDRSLPRLRDFASPYTLS